jgi:hypothetical protein
MRMLVPQRDECGSSLRSFEGYFTILLVGGDGLMLRAVVTADRGKFHKGEEEEEYREYREGGEKGEDGTKGPPIDSVPDSLVL